MKKAAFTLLELMIVVIIVGVLASLAMPRFQGAIIKAKMAELYNTVDVIERAEEIYYYRYENYAAAIDGISGGDLPPHANSDHQEFRDVLGVDIPNNSEFIYAVCYGVNNNPPTRIFVFARKYYADDVLCCKIIGGGWIKEPNGPHRWGKYLVTP